MKKLLSVVAVGCFLAMPALALCAEPGYEANFNLFVGGKFLNSDWDDVDQHGAYGVMYDVTREGWPVCIALDYFFSKESDSGSGFKLVGETNELHVGIRQYMNRSSSLQPYLGAGAAYVKADLDRIIDGEASSDDDGTVGVWLEGGLKWMAGQHFNVGLDVQYTRAEVTMFNEDVEAGGVLTGMTLGYRW